MRDRERTGDGWARARVGFSAGIVLATTLWGCTRGSSPEAFAGLALESLGIGVYRVDQEGPIVAAVVSELIQGADLNGDGSALGFVLFAHDISSRRTTNLGFAVNPFGHAVAIGDGCLAFVVKESVDLNGDGDSEDEVIHVHDLASGQTTNMGLATSRQSPTFEGSTLVMIVNELQQGEDLNGNGVSRASEDVVLLYDADSGVVTNLGLAIGYFGFDFEVRVWNDRLIYSVSEYLNGGDRNGDGDALDDVLQVEDLSTGASWSTGLALSTPEYGSHTFTAEDDFLVLEVSEAAQGATDRNGDGDAEDELLHAIDLRSRATFRLPLGTPDWFLEGQVGGGYAALRIAEPSAGDLNGDGDSLDNVLHVWDLRVRTLWNTELAVEGRSRVHPGLIAGFAYEPFQGSQDLNQDGDLNDLVVHLIDPVSGLIVNTQRQLASSGEIEVDEGWVAIGSRDATNAPLEVLLLNTKSQEEVVLDLAGDALTLDDGRLSMNVHESVRTIDLNGDGDTTDVVPHFYDLSARRLLNSRRAGRFQTRAVGERFLLSIHEDGKDDLNGDGDTQDLVLHVGTLRTGG